MPCYSPLLSYVNPSEKTPNGKRLIQFTDNQTEPLPLPCGQCIGCRLERSRQWAIRCLHESQMHSQNCFVTLTIDPNQSTERQTTLIKRDVQLFIKRLRKKFSNRKILYFYCGEYGEKYSRPHYHICFFNLDFPDKILHSTNSGNPLYSSETLSKLWGKGHALIGDLTFESAAYTARYITKKITGPRADEYYSGRLPEFINMSLKPAIGLRWIEKFHSDVYPLDSCILRGTKVRPAKYYDKYFDKNFPHLFEKIALAREDKAHDFHESPESQPHRLTARHEFILHRGKSLTRPLEDASIEFQHHKQDYDWNVINYKKGLSNA